MTTSEADKAVWLFRGGKKGEYEALSFENKIALLGFQEVPDLSNVGRGEVRAMLGQELPHKSNQSLGKIAPQVEAFRHDIKIGDTLVMPIKYSSNVRFGKVKGEYEFAEIGEDRRHVRGVEWSDELEPKSNLAPSVLSMLNAYRTIYPESRPGAVKRYQEMEEEQHTTEKGESAEAASDFLVEAPIEQIAADRLAQKIHDSYPKHDMEFLVGEVLKASGYVVLRQEKKGSDLGSDALAGGGQLGFDSPRICVQVKDQADTVGAPEIQRLRGAMGTFGAEQGLFVSWSGYTSDARAEARRDFFTLRLWDADDLIKQICENYDRMPDEIRSKLPLKQIWILDEDKLE